MIRHLIPRDDNERSFSASSTRNKRSVLPFGGNILHSLFGTATDDQVNRLDRKVGRVIEWAKKKGKLISKILNRDDNIAMKVKVLQTRVRWFNLVTKESKSKLDRVAFETDLILLEALVKMIIDVFQRLEEALTLAQRGIVTPNLILPGDLSDIIKQARKNYDFQPIYSFNQLTHYYSILHSCVLGDHVFVFIPFSSTESLTYFEIRPFPTLINNSLIVELNVESNLVLLTKDLRYVAFPSPKSLQDDCLSVTLHEWLCPATNLHFQPSINHLCLLDVLIQHNISSHCKLTEVNVTRPVIAHLNSFNYLFLPMEIPMTVHCGMTNPVYKRKGGNVIRDTCGIEIPDVLKVFPSHVEQTTHTLYTAEDVNIILPKYSTSHLQESVVPLTSQPDIIEDGEDDLWDLDTYHEVHSMVVLPTALILVVVIAVVVVRCWFLRKAKQFTKTVELVRDSVSAEPKTSPTTSEDVQPK